MTRSAHTRIARVRRTATKGAHTTVALANRLDRRTAKAACRRAVAEA